MDRGSGAESIQKEYKVGFEWNRVSRHGIWANIKGTRPNVRNRWGTIWRARCFPT